MFNETSAVSPDHFVIILKKRAEMVKFHVLLLFEQVSVVIQQKLHVKTIVKHEISPSPHVCDNLK